MKKSSSASAKSDPFEQLSSAAAERYPAQREIEPTRLADFVRGGWHILHPGQEPLWNWHVDAISEHLEAIASGDIQKLAINIPPGHAKSLLVSVYWPAWMWTHRPSWQGIFSSYAIGLAIRDSVRCRDVMASEWYQDAFNPDWRFKGDQNVKSYFENTLRGWRLSLSVGSQGTGYRGDAVCTDDPLNARDRHSATKREAAADWWMRTMSNRLNDMASGAHVMVGQRLHEQDTFGEVYKAGGYEVLCLPSEFEPDRRSITFLGKGDSRREFWRDPRVEPGELLFPQLFTRAVLEGQQRDLLDQYAGQHQQRPAPKDGDAFKRSWFEDNLVIAAPVAADYIRFWDKAGSAKKSADWTVGVLMCRCRRTGLYYVVDVVRGQWDTSDREGKIRETALSDRARYGQVTIWLEQEGGSSGIDSAKASVKNLEGFTAYYERATGEKSVRFEPFAAQAKVGNIKFVRSEGQSGWNAPYLSELIGLWNGAHDDQADATSGSFNKLALAIAAGSPATGGSAGAMTSFGSRSSSSNNAASGPPSPLHRR